MAVEVPRGSRDSRLDEIANALVPYERKHPKSKIAVYRQNPVSVRVRIIDPDFEGMSDADRDDYVWAYFDQLSDEARDDITMLVPLTPRETKRSIANLEFDHPVTSSL